MIRSDAPRGVRLGSVCSVSRLDDGAGTLASLAACAAFSANRAIAISAGMARGVLPGPFIWTPRATYI
jgi:hypothetical protein